MPDVSVIIPTYDRSEFLRTAIASVLAQTLQDFEIIVVDDASADDTQEVVGNLDDGRIRYIRHEINKGVAATRNTGVLNSKGKYIAFLDDDDKWFPEKLTEHGWLEPKLQIACDLFQGVPGVLLVFEQFLVGSVLEIKEFGRGKHVVMAHSG